MRPTNVYAKILMLLNSPKYLKDATAYGLKLEMLARTYLNNENLNIDLLTSERAQMISGDIPVFYATSMSENITLSDGKTVTLFEKNAMDSIKEKIQNASEEDYERQIHIIEEVFALSKRPANLVLV